jgi:hypothetical protein
MLSSKETIWQCDADQEDVKAIRFIGYPATIL